MRPGGMNIIDSLAWNWRRPAIVLAAMQGLLFASGAHGFERAPQADYDRLAFCYGQQVGAANALADNSEHWQRIDPQPDARQAETIGMAKVHAVELSTLADKTAALFEDLDHPGYGVDFVSTTKAYDKGYAFWQNYTAIDFSRRVSLKLTEEMLGMSPECWKTIFALEAINAKNAAAGELRWEE